MNPTDSTFMPLLQSAAGALIEMAPETAKSAYCHVFEENGRLRYEIGGGVDGAVQDHPTDDLHRACFEIYRDATRSNKAFTPFRISVNQEPHGNWGISFRLLSEPAEANVTSEADSDDRWRQVYLAREHFYNSHFGPLPDDIQKLMNLAGVWPGGGIYTLDAPRLGGVGITTSFGLTNLDMPTRVALAEHSREGATSKATLQARVPRWVHPSLAGYGYEVAIVTPKAETWPLLALAWFVQMEILNDIDLLGRVDKHHGLTVQDIAIGDGSEEADFFVERARPPFPAGIELMNGRMNLLIATRVTRDEMNFSLEHGRPELSKRLSAAGVGQISDLSRPSIPF